jgi:hypothetical protein
LESDVRNITPAHLRCGPFNCPSVHELEDGRLLIVGKRTNVSAEVLSTMDLATEEAVIIDRALLATIRDEVREECANIAGTYLKDGDWDKDTCEAIARDIRALKETPHE